MQRLSSNYRFNHYKGYHYHNVFMEPEKVIVSSRSECDTSFTLGGRSFDIPVIAANMKSVVDEKTCEFLAANKMFYIMHRFDVNPVDFCKSFIDKGLYTSISIGVNESSYKDLENLKLSGIDPDYITLDIANAWSVKAEKMTKYIKSNFKSFLICGNVGSCHACKDLELWGADAIKVGIGGGCFVRDSKVFIKESEKSIEKSKKSIEKVIIGDLVLTHKGNYKKVIGTSRRKEYNCVYKINDIKCTKNHEFYVLNRKYKDIVNDENIEEYAEWIAAESLTKDFLLLKIK